MIREAWQGLRRAVTNRIPVTRGQAIHLQQSNQMLRERVRQLAEQVAGQTHSGVAINHGRFDYEFNDELKGVQRWITLEKMEADPHIKGALRTFELPLVNAEWEYVPASDKPKDIEVAEFLNANLLRRHTDRYGPEYWTRTSWKAQRLPEILRMLVHGFSMFHKSWRIVGGKRVLDNIQWLEPSSVDPSQGWKFDDFDVLRSVVRTYQTSEFYARYKTLEEIPAEQIVLYPFDFYGARYEGRPFIRSMYGAWFRKDHIQRYAAIWSQKVGAPSPIGLFPAGYDNNDILRFQEFIETSRGTAPANNFFVGPKGADGDGPTIDYFGGALNVERGMTELIDSENREISHLGTKSQMLGETQTGSRAVGETLQTQEYQAIESLGRKICEYEMHGVGNMPGLAEELVRENFNVVDRPELVVRGIRPDEGLEHFEEILRAWSGGIIPHHEDARRQIAELLNVDLPDEAYEIQPMAAPGNDAPEEPDGVPSGPDTDNTTEQPGAAMLAESLEDFRNRIRPLLVPIKEGTPDHGGRFRNRLEDLVCDLAEVQQAHRIGERDYLAALRSIRRGMTEDLLRRVRSGKINERSLGSQRRSKYRGEKKALSALTEVGGTVGRVGMEHVRNELERLPRVD